MGQLCSIFMNIHELFLYIVFPFPTSKPGYKYDTCSKNKTVRYAMLKILKLLQTKTFKTHYYPIKKASA